jgi:hypothetical protein
MLARNVPVLLAGLAAPATTASTLEVRTRMNLVGNQHSIVNRRPVAP